MAKFKVSIKNKAVFASIQRSIINDINEVLGGHNLLNEVGEFVSDRIRFQARTKKPLNVDGSFPTLKPSTVRNRRYLAKHNVTHETFDAPRSNLTITGQLLGSITHVINGVGKVLVDVSGLHIGYLSGTGRRGKSIENKVLREYLAEKDFVIFDKSIEDNKIIKSRIKTIVLRFIRRALAVRNRLAKK